MRYKINCQPEVYEGFSTLDELGSFDELESFADQLGSFDDEMLSVWQGESKELTYETCSKS